MGFGGLAFGGQGMDYPQTLKQWMARAAEARSLAERMRDAEARSTMLAIAAGYEKLAKRAEVITAEAPASIDIYRSSNGDRWRLISDSVSGRRLVRHEANPRIWWGRSQRPRWMSSLP